MPIHAVRVGGVLYGHKHEVLSEIDRGNFPGRGDLRPDVFPLRIRGDESCPQIGLLVLRYRNIEGVLDR